MQRRKNLIDLCIDNIFTTRKAAQGCREACSSPCEDLGAFCVPSFAAAGECRGLPNVSGCAWDSCCIFVLCLVFICITSLSLLYFFSLLTTPRFPTREIPLHSFILLPRLKHPPSSCKNIKHTLTYSSASLLPFCS